MESGWWWVHVDSLTVTNTPLWWELLTMWGCAHVGREDTWKLSELSAPFCYELKLLYKLKPLNKKPKTSHNRSSTTSSPVHVSEHLMLHPIHPLNFAFIDSKLWTLKRLEMPSEQFFSTSLSHRWGSQKSFFSFYLIFLQGM